MPKLAYDERGRITHAVDPHFTHVYAQPATYRFCQDSILTPLFIAEQLRAREITPDFRALDLCAGCGVMGFELSYHEPRIKQFDFIEIQGATFRDVFAQNLALTGKGEGFRFLELNYADTPASSYDLIIANPPYFFAGDGLLSQSPEKNRCRFFLDSDFETLILSVHRALKVGAEAYILMKSGERHGRSAYREASRLLDSLARLSKVADIRGTDLVRITRLV